MSKIVFEVDRETNFVYHMLSVGQCGYSNTYGEKYRGFHSEKDLALLKRYEELLTVNGGEHCGRLYWHLVACPACGKMPAKLYYQAVKALFLTKDALASPIEDAAYLLSGFADLRDVIVDVCDVMIRNYESYLDLVWPGSQREIAEYIPLVSCLFEDSDFARKAEMEVGVRLEAPYFRVMMTNSMENGPEAIDISPDQDVFSITGKPEDTFRFIAHEYIIYLLKSALADTPAFRDFTFWTAVESLAEYYLRQSMGGIRIDKACEGWVARYEEIRKRIPGATAKELFLEAIQPLV